MSKLKRIIFVFVLVIQHQFVFCSDSIVAYGRLDFASRWLWRGISYSATPVIQPSIGFRNSKLNANIWANHALGSSENSEIDIFAEYYLSKWLTFGFTDFFGIPDSMRNDQEFLNLNRETTTHFVEFFFVLKPLDAIPISLSTSVWFWGADRDESTKKQRYSSYIELAYTKSLDDLKLSFFLGGTPNKGFYAQRAAIVNTGISLVKEYKVTNSLRIPLKVECVYNPYLQNVFVNGMLSVVF